MSGTEIQSKISLLILAAVPRKINAGYLARWNNHRSGKTDIPFSALAKMMVDYRRRMLNPNPPEACMLCPRF